MTECILNSLAFLFCFLFVQVPADLEIKQEPLDIEVEKDDENEYTHSLILAGKELIYMCITVSLLFLFYFTLFIFMLPSSYTECPPKKDRTQVNGYNFVMAYSNFSKFRIQKVKILND